MVKQCGVASLAALMTLMTLMAACTPLQEAPPAQQTAGEEPRARPELTLNLPRAAGRDCACPQTRDTTFFDRGLRALAEGRVVEAAEHFRRYRRLEGSPLAQWESDIALAWVSMLPDSPFFDRQAVADALQRLGERPADGVGVHAAAVLMYDALQSFAVMHRHLQDLEQVNSTLEQDLEKREEAIKRLRELTLGQSGAARP